MFVEYLVFCIGSNADYFDLTWSSLAKDQQKLKFKHAQPAILRIW